jgi:hypothetical protein
MKHTTKLLVIIATAVSTVAFAGAGWAYWATTGAGAASATVGTLVAPVITTPVAATGSTVSLTWSAVAAPGAGSVRYFVLRDNAAASTACGTSASPIAGTSCSDTSVPNGLHSYTVTAKFQSWTATSASASVSVNGDTVPPTVTINQAAGQADPTNNGTVNFTVVFSESVTGFTGADVAVSGTAQIGSITKTVTGGPTSYTVAVSGVTGNGTVTATVPAGVAQDPAGNANLVSTSTDNTVTLDTTAPVGSAISTTNKTPGGVSGKAESGDRVTLAYSEGMNPTSVLSGWNGSSTNVTVRITDGNNTNGLNDRLTVWDTSNTNPVALGTIDLGAKVYVTGDVSFSTSSIALSGSIVTITLGSVSDSTKVATITNNNRAVWTPSATSTDLAGNAAATSVVQSGNVTQF